MKFSTYLRLLPLDIIRSDVFARLQYCTPLLVEPETAKDFLLGQLNLPKKKEEERKGLAMSDQSLARIALQTWDANAAAWDASVGLSGTVYWQALQEPCLDRLLGARLSAGSCTAALELSTGNGIGARWLAARGAEHVTATDGSVSMLEGARAHGDADGRIVFRKLDVTEAADFGPFVEEAGAVRFIPSLLPCPLQNCAHVLFSLSGRVSHAASQVCCKLVFTSLL